MTPTVAAASSQQDDHLLAEVLPVVSFTGAERTQWARRIRDHLDAVRAAADEIEEFSRRLWASAEPAGVEWHATQAGAELRSCVNRLARMLMEWER